MTDDELDEPAADSDPNNTTERETPDGDMTPSAASPEAKRPLTEYAQWAAFAILVLVALIGTVRLYFSLSTVIETFVTRRYRPLFMTGFNLAVVLACALGLSVLARRR